MSWRWVAAGVGLFVIVILGIYFVAASSVARQEQADLLHTFVDTVPAATPCREGSRPVAMTKVSTGLANAKLARGDADVASNDWTRIEVGYRFERDTAEYALRLRLTWSAQEANADKSLASTLIRSERVVELFSLPAECADLRIADLGSLSPAEGRIEEWVQGQQHGFVKLPDVGVLREVQVRFDGPGPGDVQRQTLQADLPAFAVRVARRPP